MKTIDERKSKNKDKRILQTAVPVSYMNLTETLNNKL